MERYRVPTSILRLLCLAVALSAAILHSDSVYASAASGCPVHELRAGTESIAPLNGVCVTVDRNHRFTPRQLIDGQVPLTVSHHGEPVFSHSDYSHWLLLRLHNASRQAMRWYLQVDYPQLDHLEAFILGGPPASMFSGIR